MAAEDRFIFGRFDVALSFTGQLGTMNAKARATSAGLELLWGSLTSELRAQLEAGGCSRPAFQDAVLAAWRAWSEITPGPVHLVLKEGEHGYELMTLASDDGPPTAVDHLVRAAFFIEYRWRNDAGRLPVLTADDGGPDLWAMLPKAVQAQLEGEGTTPDALGVQVLTQARAAIAQSAGGRAPTVVVHVGKKKQAQPAALKAWRERART